MKEKLFLFVLLSCLAFVALAGPDSAEVADAKQTSIGDPIRTVRVLAGKNTPPEVAREALLSVPGVQDVDLITSPGTAIIRFDVEKTDLTKVQKALSKISYTPWFH